MYKWLGLVLVFCVALVYRDSFTASFFQDDKILLGISSRIPFWQPIANFPYRPIAIQFFYGICYFLFGQNVFGYHLILFLVFVATLFVIFSLADHILKSKKKALTTTFFYALNISLFANFYWVATSYFTLGAFFFFLTVLLYLKNNRIFFLTFVLAVLTNEIGFVLPLIFFLIRRPKVPVLVLTGGLLLARLIFAGYPQAPDYNLALSIAPLRWYAFRALNLPEGVDRIGNPLIFIFLGAFLVLVLFGEKSRRIFLLGLAWFLIAALPFYFLPAHQSSYYLTMALFGPALYFGNALGHKLRLLIIAISIYLVMTIIGLEFLRQTHWIILKNTGPIGQF